MYYQNAIHSLKDITPEELNFLQHIMSGMNEEQSRQFVTFYTAKRKAPADTLIFALLGFVGVAGVHRFVLGQIGMGILYIITAGLCFIGTIVDLINYRSLTLGYNERVAIESAKLVQMTVR
jgi:TM2 domain-containing membrane protein YozV